MEDPLLIINKMMEKIFYDILEIEENAIRRSSFSDVSITEIHTVAAIGLFNNQTTGEVAKKLSKTVGTLTVAIDNLVKKDYVKRTRCENDRRLVYLNLTKKGRVLYRMHDLFHRKAAMASIEGLTEIETDAVSKALEKVHCFLEENYIKNMEDN